MIKLTKIQLERISEILDRHVRAQISKYEKMHPMLMLTQKEVADLIFKGKIKLKKSVPEQTFCTGDSIGKYFDFSSLEKTRESHRETLAFFSKRLMDKKQEVLDRIILSGQTVEWVLKQFEEVSI